MCNKIRKPLCIQQLIWVIFSTMFLLHAEAQSTEQKLTIINSIKDYQNQVKDDSLNKMVELKSLIPGIVYDLRYATTNNFMNRRMYPANTNITFLRLPVAKALQKVQEELNEKGLGLKIFDAYRPYSVTVKFWELVQDERYVATPAKGSGHNRGIAVDLTIINLKTREELDMGTGFDNFTDTAYHSFTKLTEEILQNRILLKSIMEKYGFRAYDTEWWHYYFANGDKFEVLDLDFKKLRKNVQ